MVATIIAVIKSKQILATYWEFDFTVGNCQTLAIEGTVSFDEAVAFSKRTELGPVAVMCLAIKATPPIKFAGLVGKTFQVGS